MLDDDGERLHREDGRQRQRHSSPNVDVRAVPRTDRDAVVEVELALAEGPVVVRAAILERVQLAVQVVDADGDRARVDDLDGARRKLVQRRDSDERQS